MKLREKIAKVVVLITFFLAIGYSGWFYTFWYHEYLSNMQMLKNRYESGFEKITKELTGLEKDQEAIVEEFSKSLDENLLTQVTHTNKHLNALVYLNKNEDKILLQDSRKKYNFDVEEIQDYRGDTGWVEAKFQKHEYMLFGYYVSQVVSPSGKTLGYLVGVYHLPQTSYEINEMIYTFGSYAEIVDAKGTKMIHPFLYTSKPNDEYNLLAHSPKYIEPLAGTNGWNLVFHLQSKDALPVTRKIFLQQLFLELAFSLAIIMLIGVTLDAHFGKTKGLVAISASVVVNFLIICGFVLYTFTTNYTYSHDDAIGFKNIYKKIHESRGEATLVLTAIKTENITMVENTSYVVSGLLIQTYPIDANIEPGLIFPDAVGSSTSLELISKKIEGKHITYIWQFSQEFGKLFSQKHFPLDRQKIDVLFWPKDVDKKVFFVPDVPNVKNVRPNMRPGLDMNVDVSNWMVDKSYYSLSNRAFDYYKPANFPYSLIYRVQIQRSLVSAFVTNLMPLFICMVLTFALITIPIKQLEQPTLPSVSLVIAIIFVVTVNQMSLRNNLGIHTFTYIEYLFAIYYIQLLLMTLNFILYTTREKPLFIIGYRQNLVPKLMYWPVLVGTFMLVLVSGFS